MKELFEKVLNRKTDSVKWLNQPNKNALPFWVADADYQTAPIIIDALIKRVNEGHFGYSVITNEFINAIINWYKNRYQRLIEPNWIIPLPDVLIAIKVAIEAFTNIGDEIVVQTPVYHRFFHIINISNRLILENKLINDNGNYIIDFDDLELSFKRGVKMIIICSPHNPVGRVWTKDELARLIMLCQKYHVLLISDEIHGDIIMPNHHFLSTSNWFKEGYPLIICSSPSKTFNLAGLRTGYTVICDEKTRTKYLQQVSSCCIPSINVLGMVATTAAYEGGGAWVDAQNEHINNNYSVLKNFFEEHLPDVFITPLEGTYLCWLDFRRYQKNSQQLMALFYDNKISVNDGASFGTDYDGFIRFNLACPTSQLLDGLNLIKKAFCSK